jgi:hypothetical protein
MAVGKPSTEDDKDLKSFDEKMYYVADLVAGVVRGYSYGLYLYGPGGVGKSYSALQTLRQLRGQPGGRPYDVLNTHVTAAGLFQMLRAHPESIFLLEDMEPLTMDPDAQCLLRAALGDQQDDGPEGGWVRPVRWTTAPGGPQVFDFPGGMIITANTPLRDVPQLRALRTRIDVHELTVTDAELAAKMRQIASSPWRHNHLTLDAGKCREVAELVISECHKASCPLDLRMFPNACRKYCQWEAGHSACHWHDLVAHHVRQAAAHFRHEVATASRAERLEAERDIVRGIVTEADDPAERVRLWRERTGKGQSTFYARFQEVRAETTDAPGPPAGPGANP